jgi:hypothetical protein
MRSVLDAVGLPETTRSRWDARSAALWSRAPVLAAPAALAALCVVVQVVYLRPLSSSQDGMNYFERAAAFPNVPADQYSLRIGLLVPVRAFQALFGYSEAAYYAVPFLAGVALVLGTYWLGSRLFSPTVGIGAAVLIVLNGIFLDIGTVLFPDALGAALLVAALSVVVLVAERELPWGRREHTLLAGAGLLLGWAYLVREFIVFAFPAVVLVFWAYRRPWKPFVWVAAAALTVFAGELVLNAIVHGDPFVRLVTSGGHGGQRDYIIDSRLDALVRFPRALDDITGGVPLIVPFALLPFAFVIKKRQLELVAGWFLSFWVPITLGSGLIVPSYRLLRADQLRYWTPVIPAVVIGGMAVADHTVAWVVSKVGRAGALRAARAVLLVLVVGLGLAGSADDRSRDLYRANGATQLVELRAWLAHAGHDVPVIWTDPFTARLVRVYSRTTFGDLVWHGKVRSFVRGGRILDASKMDRGAVVLFGPAYRILYRVPPVGRPDVPEASSPIAGWIVHPPAGWERAVYRSDGSLVVFRIGSGG